MKAYGGGRAVLGSLETVRTPRLIAGGAVAAVSVLAAGAEVAYQDPGALIRSAHEAESALLPVTADSPGLPVSGGDVTDDLRPEPRFRPPTAGERREILKQTLADAARRHGLDPGLVMAVAWWESGWDMSQVSSTGAVGMMQVDPATARDLGPQLLHRQVDVHRPYDNADLGAAVLKADLDDAGGNLAVALASYYEGSGNVDPANLDPGAQTYVEGVTSLQKQFDAGKDPTTP